MGNNGSPRCRFFSQHFVMFAVNATILVTAAATPAQLAYFRDERFALLGVFHPDGTLKMVEPLRPPEPEPPAQGELF